MERRQIWSELQPAAISFKKQTLDKMHVLITDGNRSCHEKVLWVQVELTEIEEGPLLN